MVPKKVRGTTLGGDHFSHDRTLVAYTARTPSFVHHVVMYYVDTSCGMSLNI